MRNIFGAELAATRCELSARLLPRQGVRTCTSQRGQVMIGKINIILICLIVVILIGLISKDESSPALTAHVMRVESQIDKVPPAASDPVREIEPVKPFYPSTDAAPMSASKPAFVPQKNAQASIAKPGKKNHAGNETVAQTQVISAPNTEVAESSMNHEPAPAEVMVSKEPTRKVLVFNIWSVSELRLRTAYASYLNDSAIPAMQLEARKKEYLSFVSHRTKKCGELDNRFASNINTVEKLTINKSDVEVLECHANENNLELNKLNA